MFKNWLVINHISGFFRFVHKGLSGDIIGSAMEDFSGGIAVYHPCEESEDDEEDLFQIIEAALDKGFAVTATRYEVRLCTPTLYQFAPIYR